jgi:hypothetical protein
VKSLANLQSTTHRQNRSPRWANRTESDAGTAPRNTEHDPHKTDPHNTTRSFRNNRGGAQDRRHGEVSRLLDPGRDRAGNRRGGAQISTPPPCPGESPGSYEKSISAKPPPSIHGTKLPSRTDKQRTRETSDAWKQERKKINRGPESPGLTIDRRRSRRRRCTGPSGPARRN